MVTVTCNEAILNSQLPLTELREGGREGDGGGEGRGEAKAVTSLATPTKCDGWNLNS